jgi:CRP-like cAMP-binding protein
MSKSRELVVWLMATAITQTAVCKNRILTGLPREQYDSLFSNLTPVNLHYHQVLYDAGDDIRCAYFINDGMASLMCITTEGSSIEVGNVGNEGIVGIPVLLRHVTSPHQVVVLVPGEALAVTTDTLKGEFNKEGELKNRLLSYTQALVTYMSQLGVCNHFHTVDKRLCRWLLISSLQVHSQSFHLTHDALSQVPRCWAPVEPESRWLRINCKRPDLFSITAAKLRFSIAPASKLPAAIAIKLRKRSSTTPSAPECPALLQPLCQLLTVS